MQNDKFEKYIPLIYRILCIISTHASGLSGKRLRGYVFAGLLLSGKRFRRRLLYCFAVRWLGAWARKRLRRDDATSIFAIV